MMKFDSRSGILALAFLCLCNNSTSDPTAYHHLSKRNVVISAKPAKWFNNRTSAVSITCDIPTHVANNVVNEIVNRSLTADFELVTAAYILKDKDMQRRVESYFARGIHFFGHGHEHLYYDTVSYKVAVAMFDTCYKLMCGWNLGPPLSYAYPYGAGNNPATQKAIAEAGFICARGICYNIDTFIVTNRCYDPDSFFICSGEQKEPSNWFNLPAACVGFYVPQWINTHTAMVNMCTKNAAKNAWLIFMYHDIDMKNEDAYYPLSDFRKDLDYLIASDTWVANMDVVARYIRERNNSVISYKNTGCTVSECMIEFSVKDTLNTPYKKVPLTILVEISGDTLSDRCDVTTLDGRTTTYAIVNNQFSMNLLPDGTNLGLRFYTDE